MKKIVFYILIIFPVMMIAQEITLKGTIIEQDANSPLPGVSISIKESSKGVVSDFDGNFEIVTKIGDTIVASYIGMTTQELPVFISPITIVMVSDVNQLEEVTINVGYFEVSKKDLSGSVSQINSEQIEKNRTNSIENLIQGQAAGVVVSESSEPGGGIGVSIRGVNSMLGGTQPLYVLDGVPVDPITDAQGNGGAGEAQSSLGFLNPNDIEKIEILKDAAATSLYGARGANGVVLITTKTASKSEGVDKISVNYDTSITTVRKNIGVLDGPGFEQYMNQRKINQLYQDISDPNRAGGAFDGSQELTEANYPELAGFTIPYTESTGINTNWQDETYRMAYTNSFNLGYRGGNFKRNAPHVLQAKLEMKQDIKPLAFQEYSRDYSHKEYTIGFAGRPSTAEHIYISTRDNTRNHGPGSQGSKTEADGIIGKIIGDYDIYKSKVLSSYVSELDIDYTKTYKERILEVVDQSIKQYLKK